MRNAGIVLLAFMVFASGCVGTSRPVKVSASDGLQIDDFSADVNDVFSGETVRLSLEVENVGGTTARGVKAKLFGGASGWGDGSVEKTVGRNNPSGTNVLDPPIIDTNIPGDFNKVVWSVKSPSLEQGLVQTYDMGVRVRYSYSTTSVTPIDVISYDEFDRQRKTNSFSPSPIQSKNSNAPIKVEVTGSAPLRAGGDAKVSEPVTLTLTNVGDGIVFRRDDNAYPASATLGKVSVNIASGTPSATLKCDLDGMGNFATSGEATMGRGLETARIPCTFEMTGVQTGLPKETIQVSVTAQYSYTIDKIIPIKVTSNAGAPALPSGSGGGATTTTVSGGATTTTVPDSTGPVMGDIVPIFAAKGAKGEPQQYLIRDVSDPESGIQKCTVRTDIDSREVEMLKQGKGDCRGTNAGSKCEFTATEAFRDTSDARVATGGNHQLTVTCTNNAAMGNIKTQIVAQPDELNEPAGADATPPNFAQMVTDSAVIGVSTSLMAINIQDEQSGVQSCALYTQGGLTKIDDFTIQGPVPCQKYACSGVIFSHTFKDTEVSPNTNPGYQIICTNRAGIANTVSGTPASNIFMSAP